MKQQICILGSTGSIGTQALDVIEQHSDLYEVYCLTANNRVKELAEQAHKFHPAAVVVANEAHYDELKNLLSDEPDIKVYAGAQALCDIVQAKPIDMVLASMVGFSGLEPTIHAIKARKKICLANKETLVVAGELICNLAQEYHVPILPVDSEHSAIFQSLVGEGDNEVRETPPYLLRRSFPQLYPRATGEGYRCRCAEASYLGYGRQDYHRFCVADEQGLRGDRG